MSIKARVIISMISAIFLAATAVLVTNTLLLSYLLDSNRLANAVSYFVLTGILAILVLLAVSIPFIIIIAKSVSSPVDKMLDKSRYDTLTGIFNRRYVDENLKNLISFISRSGGKLTVFMIDIDYFSKYNEKYGYNNGDNCLKFIANALTKSIARAEDFAARYGGKEFVVVLPNTDENGAHVMAQRMMTIIKECKIPHETNEAAEYLTISIGAVTGKPDSSQNSEDYINRANEMLKKSVHDGCNRYTLDIF